MGSVGVLPALERGREDGLEEERERDGEDSRRAWGPRLRAAPPRPIPYPALSARPVRPGPRTFPTARRWQNMAARRRLVAAQQAAGDAGAVSAARSADTGSGGHRGCAVRER